LLRKLRDNKIKIDRSALEREIEKEAHRYPETTEEETNTDLPKRTKSRIEEVKPTS